MNMPSRFAIERSAHQLRREEWSRLMTILVNAIGVGLRRHHEVWLRSKEIRKVSALIGTPV